MKPSFAIRFLAAIAWIVFAVLSAVTVTLRINGAAVPFWIPFAVPVGLVGVVAVGLFIISGPSIFKDNP